MTDSGLNNYLDEIGRQELLSDEQERELSERIKQGDQSAISQLAEANLRFVVKLAATYRGRGLQMDDLVSEGNIGLLNAAAKFDASRGTRFVNYAAPYVRRQMERAIEQQGNIIHDAPASVGFTNSRVDMAVAKSNRNADENIAFLSADSELAGSLGCLNERERKVIIMYYGLGTDALTMMEIANEMGLKRERVRQIRKKAERKLRKTLTMLNNEKK